MLIINGLFRKCVIADQCALIANAAFSGTLGPPDLGIVALGTYAFAWQIYGDFSGYSNIARGSAQLLGFHFMVNFRQPYLSTSIQEFWRRWHISLSTWLRDYLYIGLGGNRGGPAKTYRNLVATMLIGGLWHGANWTFVVWGGLHGCWLAIERALRGDGVAAKDTALTRWLKRIAVFHGVCVAWVFFRAESIADAFRFLSGVVQPTQWSHVGSLFVYLAVFTLPLAALDLAEDRRKEEYWGQLSNNAAQLAIAVLLLVVVIAFTANETSAFIYFQF